MRKMRMVIGLLVALATALGATGCSDDAVGSTDSGSDGGMYLDGALCSDSTSCWMPRQPPVHKTFEPNS